MLTSMIRPCLHRSRPHHNRTVITACLCVAFASVAGASPLPPAGPAHSAWVEYAPSPESPDMAGESELATADTAGAVPLTPQTEGTAARPGVLGSAARVVTAFGSDAWYIASSPARMNRSSAVWLGGVLVVGGILYANDEALTRASIRNRSNRTYDVLLDVGQSLEPIGFMGRTNPFYVGALGLGLAFRVRPLVLVPSEILESHLIAGGFRNVAKVIVGRSRPFENRGSRSFKAGGGTSFPSGHVSVAFELATILSHHAHYAPVSAVGYGLAATMALQRVDSRSHWASDVFIPAFSGTLIARTVIHRREHDFLAIAPILIPGTTSPGLGMTLRF